MLDIYEQAEKFLDSLPEQKSIILTVLDHFFVETCEGWYSIPEFFGLASLLLQDENYPDRQNLLLGYQTRFSLYCSCLDMEPFVIISYQY